MAYALKNPEVTCKDCGITFMRKSVRQVRCPKCQNARSKGRADKPRAVKEASKERREGVKSSICDTKTCARCIYSFSLSGTLACDYILATGHSRGCPAGTGRDKRQTGKRKKKALRI